MTQRASPNHPPLFPPVVYRYGLALLFTGGALLFIREVEPVLGQNLAALLFAAVMLSAWFGGLGPSLLSSAIVAYFSAYPFHHLPESPGFGWDDSVRTLVFLMLAVLVSSLTLLRKRAEAALKKANDELEIRIEQRTHELRRSNELLRESEERFRLLVEGVADYALVMLDPSGNVVSWNPGAQRILGYTTEQAVGRSATGFYTSDDVSKQKPQTTLAHASQQGRYEEEGWRVRLGGEQFWANVITTALRDEAGRPRGFAQVTRDVSELRELEKELLEISDRQQVRIGHDLHDGIGQELTGIALLSQNLRERLGHSNSPESAEAARIASLANGALEQTRRISRGLSPMDLGPEGLEIAVRDLAVRAEKALGRPCVFVMKNTSKVWDDTVALHLFRIAQEAVNNAVRHANAREIRVELVIMEQSATLGVFDNGVGLPPPAGRDRGMGLSIMQYRARMIGGSLEISSEPGRTAVVCSCPIQSSTESLHDSIHSIVRSASARTSQSTPASFSR